MAERVTFSGAEAYEKQRKVYVPKDSTIEEFIPSFLERDWGSEQIIAQGPGYLVKILRMKQGTRGGLQFHVEKVESFHLYEGRAQVEYDDGQGQLEIIDLTPGRTIHVPAGAVHRVTALEDCVFIEGSTPHFDDRVHAEARYGLPDETGGLPSSWVTEDGKHYQRV